MSAPSHREPRAFTPYGRGETLAVLFVCAALMVLAAAEVLPTRTVWDPALAGGAVLLAYGAAFAARRLRARRVHLWLSLDGLVRFGAATWLIARGGSAASLLWVFPTVLAVRDAPMLGRLPASLLQSFVAFAPLAAWFLLQNQPADAMMAVAVYCGVLTVQLGFAASVRQRRQLMKAAAASEAARAMQQVRLERSRLARELHDGVCADVTAIVLLLRHRKTRASSASLRRLELLEADAASILRGLREAIADLMDEFGDVGELARLLDGRRDGSRDPSTPSNGG